MGFIKFNITDNETFAYVDGFWLGFDQAPSWIYTTSIVHLVVVTVLSVIGNLVVIVGSYRNLISLSRVRPYIIAVALSDLVSPVTTYWIGIVNNIHRTWAFDQNVCSLYAFIQGFCSLLSITMLSAISCERCLAIKNPRLISRFDFRHQILTILAICVYVLLLTVPPLFGWSQYTLDGFLTSCCFEIVRVDFRTRSFFVYLLIFGFVIPVLVIATSYIIITKKLIREIKFNQSEAPAESMELKERQDGEVARRLRASSTKYNIRALLMIFLAFLAFTVTWTPYACVALIGQFGRNDLIGPYSVWAAGLVAKTATCYNPIIFTSVDTNFRKALISTWT